MYVPIEKNNKDNVCNIGKAAIPLLWKFFNKWPNPDAARKGDPALIERLMTPLGLQEKRAKIIIRFSGKYYVPTTQYTLEGKLKLSGKYYIFLLQFREAKEIIR